MRRAVVATFLGTLACGKGPETETRPTPNPTAPHEGVPAPSPEPGPRAAPDLAPAAGAGRVLNGMHADHGIVFRRPDGTCHVNLPLPAADPSLPKAGGPPPPGPPPAEVVPCPVHMKDPSWDACDGRAITGPEPGNCLCMVPGNPPPPPRIVSCPTEG